MYNKNVSNSLPDIYMTIDSIGYISRGKIEIYMMREILIYKVSVSFCSCFDVRWKKRMNEIIEKEKIKLEDMIYEIRGEEVMLSSEIYATKYHYYLYDKIITHYDIDLPISIFNNFFLQEVK